MVKRGTSCRLALVTGTLRSCCSVPCPLVWLDTEQSRDVPGVYRSEFVSTNPETRVLNEGQSKSCPDAEMNAMGGTKSGRKDGLFGSDGVCT